MRYAAVLTAALVLASCGIEDYLFLYPVPAGDVHVELNTRVQVRLPNLNTTEYYYFTHFNLYYRIYISDVPLTNEINTAGDRSLINSALAGDYSAIEPYTVTTDTMNSTNTGSLFSGRKYYTLELESVDIERILNTAALGQNIVLNFTQTPGTRPSLTMDGQTYTLTRSNGNGAFTPQPDRYFFNAPELNRSENAIATVNADVADKSGVSGPRYTYAAIYIAVVGIQTPAYTPIYSRPTFVGIFRLPERS